MGEKIFRDQETDILMALLALMASAKPMVDLWQLNPQLHQYFDFLSRNAAALVLEQTAVEQMEPGPEQEKAWRRSVWSKTSHRPLWSPEQLTSMTAQLVWRALVLGRKVNYLRRVLGMKPVSFYELASDLDKEYQDEETYLPEFSDRDETSS